MKVQVTLSSIYYNKSLADFFMRSQSTYTLEALLQRARICIEELERIIDNTSIEDFDEFEELLYNESVEEIAEFLGIDLFD